MDADIAPIGEVWAWICVRMPALAQSRGLGIAGGPPGPTTFTEGSLLFLLQKTLGLHRDGMGYSMQYGPDRDGWVKITCTLYGSDPEKLPDVRAETLCTWGNAARDAARNPTKEVLLRCAARLVQEADL